MANNYVEQIMELEAQKQALMTKAKSEALNAAEKAIADLNNLGFHYRLVEGETATPTRTVSTSTRTRRGGVADQVLETVKGSAEGMSRSQLLEVMEAHDKSAQQSISNALSNLKKKGQLTASDGVYKAP